MHSPQVARVIAAALTTLDTVVRGVSARPAADVADTAVPLDDRQSRLAPCLPPIVAVQCVGTLARLGAAGAVLAML
jgi:hypothetical protein